MAQPVRDLYLLLDHIDDVLISLPLSLRLVIWGIAAAVISTTLYALASPQRRLAGLKEQIRSIRQEVARYDGDFTGMQRLLLHQLRLNVIRVTFVLLPTLLAALPTIILFVWLSTRFDYQLPAAGTALKVCAHPDVDGLAWTPPAPSPPTSGCWQLAWPAPGQTSKLTNESGKVLLALPLDNPVPVVAHYERWNAFFPNPQGYLPRQVEVTHIRLDFAERIVVPPLPRWIDGWEPVFLASLAMMSLLIKLSFRIH